MWSLEAARWIIEELSRGIEIAAAGIIGIASVEAAIKALLLFVYRNKPAAAKTEVRLTLGRWLAVGLEFELAADILRTSVTPSWQDIGQLAAIAALRTALNYFLAKEIEKESSADLQAGEQRLDGSSVVRTSRA